MNVIQRKHPAHIRYLVEQILATCKDAESSRFYSKVAQMLPDHAIFRFLAEIRQDPSIRKRGAVFATKVKRYMERHVKHAFVFNDLFYVFISSGWVLTSTQGFVLKYSGAP